MLELRPKVCLSDEPYVHSFVCPTPSGLTGGADLSQEIDIYSDWIDATEQANRAQAVEEEEEDFERPAEPRRDEGVRDKRRREVGPVLRPVRQVDSN